MFFHHSCQRTYFARVLFTVQYTLENKINVIILVDASATGYGFINEKFIEIIYQMLEIELQCLTKQKAIQGFDGRAAQPVSHAIYLILSVGSHIKSLASLLITKLGHHLMIFSCL